MYIYVYTHTYMYIYVYTHTYMYIYVYTHTVTRAQEERRKHSCSSTKTHLNSLYIQTPAQK